MEEKQRRFKQRYPWVGLSTHMVVVSEGMQTSANTSFRCHSHLSEIKITNKGCIKVVMWVNISLYGECMKPRLTVLIETGFPTIDT